MSADSNSSKRSHDSPMSRAAGVGVSLTLIFASAIVGQQLAREGRTHIAQMVLRGQFDQAELQCRQLLAKSDLNAGDRSAHTCDLIFVLSEKARRAVDGEVESAWADVAGAGEHYLVEDDDSPRRVLVELQLALAAIAEAEQMLGRVQVGQESIQAKLRGVARQLQRMGVAVDERLRISRKGRKDDPNVDGYLGRKALRAVRASVRQQRAAALLMSAATLNSNGADRAYACNEAKAELKAISPGDLASTTWWQTRLLLARCHRLAESWEASLLVLEELDAAPSATGLLSQVKAERLRLALDRQQWRPIEAALGSTKASDSADLALAQFEAMLLLAAHKRDDGNSQLANSLEARAAESLPNFESRFGSWWRRRAEKLLMASQSSVGTGTKPTTGTGELTAALARSLLADGQPLAGAAKLIDAANAAHAEDHAVAERLSREAAAVYWEAEAWRQAKVAYQELADKFATGENAAAAAHLMAIRCQAKLVRDADENSSGSKEDSNEISSKVVMEYEQLLEQHEARWPESSSTLTASWWRAKLAEQQRDWKLAAELYAKLLLKGKAEAGSAVVRCYRQAVRSETIQAEEIVSSVHGWTQSEQANRSSALLVAAARLELVFGERIDPRTIAQLAQVRSALPKASSEFEQATLLVITGAFEQHDTARAREVFLELPSTVPETPNADSPLEEALECLDRLAELNWPETATTRLQLVERYTSVRTTSADQTQRLARHGTAALSDAGQVAQSIAAARACVESSPKHLANQLLLARCLLVSTKKVDQQSAVKVAEKLISGTKTGSTSWFEAKLLLAEAWIKLGQQERASKLLRLTAALHPNWGDKKTKVRSEALMSSLAE